jgi:hypothetical protein
MFFVGSCMAELRILPGQLSILPQTVTIYERFYLIKRIEKVFEILHNDAVKRSFAYTNITPQIYQHPLIHASAKKICTLRSVEPLYELWHMCTSYQQLHDPLFAVEFVHLVYALCLELGDSKRTCKMDADWPLIEDFLHAIDVSLRYACYHEPLRSRDNEYTPDAVTTDMIIQRYLVLKRLDKSIELLQYLVQKRTMIACSGVRSSFELDVDQFTHGRIKDCIQQILVKKNLEPLLQIADDMQQYRFVADDTFLQEMLMNLFLVYKGLLLEAASETDGEIIATQMNQVLEIYENIDEMPLDETLEAIDEVTDRLLALQHKEEQHQFERLSMRVAQCLGLVGVAALICYYMVW